MATDVSQMKCDAAVRSAETEEEKHLESNGGFAKKAAIKSNDSGAADSVIVENGKTTPKPESPAHEDSQYFFEDHIFYIDKKGKVKFGVVLETCDTYSNDEDDDEGEQLSKGEIRVAFHPEGNDLVHSESSIGLADRTLMPGDVVKRAARDGNQQRGYVRDLKMCADVKVLGTKHIIKSVASDRLKPISLWQNDSTVFFDNWVGTIKDYAEKAVLKASNGSIIEVFSSEFHNFRELHSHRLSTFAPQIFYPGNTVIGRLPSLEGVKLLTPDIPLLTNRKGRMMLTAFVVQSLSPDNMDVLWLCRTFSKENSNVPISEMHQPTSRISGEDMDRVQRLNLFDPCMVQIADRMFLKYDEQDELMKKADWDAEQVIKFKPKLSAVSKIEENQNSIVNGTGTSESSQQPQADLKVVNGEGKPGKTSEVKDSSGKKQSIQHAKKTKEGCKNHPDADSASSDEWEDAESSFVFDDAEDANDDDDDVVVADADANEVNDESEANADEDEDFSSTRSSLPIDQVENHCSANNSAGSRKYSMPINVCTPYVLPYHHHLRKLTRKFTFKKTKKRVCTSLIRPHFQPKHGDLLITETLLVYSAATVVWQDGSVEAGIPSTELYPIHHLDNHEFFPGDFVTLGREDPSVSFRDYGVIQTVDHDGRTACVKWFTTYVSPDEAQPTSKTESEMSVYDLKDHPDFNFRPGTMVIRVSNFVGDNENSTVGQVVDNGPDGQVKVWWVDGYKTLNWPQDLFEIGNQDQVDFVNDDSDDSWETESEDSEEDGDLYCGEAIKAQISDYFNGLRQRLANIQASIPSFADNEAAGVLNKLVIVYKACRCLDRFLESGKFSLDLLIENLPGLEPLEFGELGDTTDMLIDSNTTEGVADPFHKELEKILDETNSELVVKILHPSEALKLNGKEPFLDYVRSTLSKKAKRMEQPAECPNEDVSNGETFKTLLIIRRRVVERKVPACSNPLECLPESYLNFLSTVSLALSDVGKTFDEGGAIVVSPVAAANQVSTTLKEDSTADSIVEVASACVNVSNDSGNCSHIDNSPESQKNAQNKKNLRNSSILICKVEMKGDLTPNQICSKLASLMTKSLSGMEQYIYDKLKEHGFTSEKIREAVRRHEDAMRKSKDAGSGTETSSEQDILMTNGETPETKDNCAANDGSKESSEDSSGAVNQDASHANDQKLETEAAPADSNTGDMEADESKKSLDESIEPLQVPSECFVVLPNAPATHKFYKSIFEPDSPSSFLRAIQREQRLLKTSLPPGVWVRTYEDRSDLFSVMMEGPKKTPYEGGLFFFDIQLSREYPKKPPYCHYISYCIDRLNPNLYEEGKVCVSLLGTWTGRDTEVWGPKSTLLQVIVSIQGLILVPEPYFNEAGYEKQKGTQHGEQNSRMYNEMAIIKMVQATTKMLMMPPPTFYRQIIEHYQRNGLAMYQRVKGWMELSKANLEKTSGSSERKDDAQVEAPEFPLLPASRGFCLSLESLLGSLKSKMDEIQTIVLEGEVETEAADDGDKAHEDEDEEEKAQKCATQ